MEIRTFADFQLKISSCVEVKVYRRFQDYFHHLFIAEANEFSCEIIHYKPSIKEFFKGRALGKICQDLIVYSEYDKIEEKILDFGNEDIFIVDRPDYPHTESDKRDAIERARSRIDESEYSFGANNCESFVNWIFTGENRSLQIETSTGKSMVADGFDSVLSCGVLRLSCNGLKSHGVINAIEKSRESVVKAVSPQGAHDITMITSNEATTTIVEIVEKVKVDATEICTAASVTGKTASVITNTSKDASLSKSLAVSTSKETSASAIKSYSRGRGKIVTKRCWKCQYCSSKTNHECNI